MGVPDRVDVVDVELDLPPLVADEVVELLADHMAETGSKPEGGPQ